MRTLPHRSITTYKQQRLPAQSPLIGCYEIRAGGGWRQYYDGEGDAQIQVLGNAGPLDELAELRVHALFSALDGLFDRMFAVIAAQPAPFPGFDIDQLEIRVIDLADEVVLIGFDSDACAENSMSPVLQIAGDAVSFCEWTC